MMENQIIILNPDYHFKNDNDRIVMYSKKNVIYDSSADWISYIHPVQAMVLGVFTEKKDINEQFSSIENHLKISHDKVEKLISMYINNKTPIYTEIGKKKIPFPKNVLIPFDNIHNEDFHYDFGLKDLQCKHINLLQDRMHKAPNSLLFMLTNKCVTSCKYCYADCKTKYKPLSTKQIFDIIEEAYKLKMSYIDIIGGEVFCRKDWDKILQKLVDLNLTPSYISTKVPFTRNIIEKLYHTGYNNVVQLSLDSLNENVLMNIINCKEGYVNKILSGIELLQEYGFKIQIDTILTNLNSDKRQIEQLFDYIKNIKNLAYWEIRVPEASIYSSDSFSTIKADKRTLSEIERYVKEEIMPQAQFQIYFSNEALKDIFHKGKPDDEYFEGGTCGILENRLFVLPDGKVSICEQLYWHPQFIIGDLTKQSFEEIWNSEKAMKLYNMHKSLFQNKSKCSSCKVLESCNSKHRRCFVKTIKAYGINNWNYPDPRCKYSNKFISDLKY